MPAGLYKKDQAMLIDGVNAMLQIATKLLAKSAQTSRNVNSIQDAEKEDGADQEHAK